MVDPTRLGRRGLLAAAADLYGPLARRGRWLWGGMWHASNTAWMQEALQASVLERLRPALERDLAAWQPHVVVSFHPLLNRVAVSALRRRPHPHPPVITVVTDLVAVHASWISPGVAAVVTATPGAFARCRRAGVPAGRCHLLGLPVDVAFTAAAPRGRALQQLRRRLGLSGGRLVVVLCGGADGSGGIERRARALAAAPLPIDLAVICGRNRKARQRLEGLTDAAGRAVPVHGFVDNMPEWMHAADLLVSKAGPGTITEAMVSGTPLLLTWYLPGQERDNVEWVVDVGAGRYVPTLRTLVDAVAELSAPRSPGLQALRASVGSTALPNAAEAIASLVRRLALRPPP